VFKVATPQDSLATFQGAATWDAVMPNACGSCHQVYRFGK
jgi:cytochrome c556